jgi:hypothetical protein
MLSREYTTNHLRFKSKYDDTDTHGGSEMTDRIKIKKLERMLEIINMFFKKFRIVSEYRNPHKLASYHHWLAPSNS